MEAAAFVFATISMVEICLKSGQKLHTLCQSYVHAEADLATLILEIEGHWIDIEDRVMVLREIWGSLDGRHQIHQNSVLQMLEGNLQSAINTLDSIIGKRQDIEKWEKSMGKKGALRRPMYALFAKSSLKSNVTQLERWRRQFDVSWILLSRITVPVIKMGLERNRKAKSSATSSILRLQEAHEARGKPLNDSPTSIFFDTDYSIREMDSILLSPASTGFTQEGGFVIVDHYFVRDEIDPQTAKRDIRDLALVLSKVDATFTSLLRCQGVIRVENPSKGQPQYQLVFAIPATIGGASPPCTLRYVLLQQTKAYPLNEKICLAVSLARSVVFLHASKIVHKNISPENIILLSSDACALGTPFLVGYQRFRFDERNTRMTGDDLWEKNLYRHPQRHGLHPEEVYTMRHDIFSVGVCLLEIGLWRSFVGYSSAWVATAPDSELNIDNYISASDKRKAAAGIKSTMVETAKAHLPRLMGRIYTDIVISCLTCLDRDGLLSEDPSEFEDEDEIIVGVRYIEKILFEMEKISV